jgi:hypothetical protein
MNTLSIYVAGPMRQRVKPSHLLLYSFFYGRPSELTQFDDIAFRHHHRSIAFLEVGIITRTGKRWLKKQRSEVPKSFVTRHARLASCWC